MKNLEYERKIRASKAYMPKRREDLYIPHCYVEPREFSWWDDISFRLGSQRVCVCWIHPRMAYHDEIDDLSYKEVCRLFPNREKADWLANSTKNYRKVGKSRKKVYSHTIVDFGDKGFFEAWREIKQKMLNDDNNGVVIKPSLKVVQWCYSRGVMPVLPIEVKSEEDCIILQKLVVSFLDGRNTVEGLFPDYEYTVKDWKEEGHEGF